MNEATVLLLLAGLIVWGVFVPWVLLSKLRKARTELEFLKGEFKSILKSLRESKKYEEESAAKFKASQHHIRNHIFATPK